MKAVGKSMAWGLALVLMLVNASALAETAFGYADLAVGSLRPDASAAEAETALGAATETDAAQTVAATGAVTVQQHYPGLTLLYTDERLSGALCTSPDYPGPRGLAVGNTEETFLQLFPYDATQANGDVLYAAGWLEDIGMPLPPSLQKTTDAQGWTLYTFTAPKEPYDAATLAEPSQILYQMTAFFDVRIDPQTGTVAAYRWYVQAFAE